MSKFMPKFIQVEKTLGAALSVAGLWHGGGTVALRVEGDIIRKSGKPLNWEPHCPDLFDQ